MTALIHGAKAESDPRRYVNASTVPYVVPPPEARAAGSARLGDLAAVWNRRADTLAFAILADVGPPGKLGEGSMALAKALGIPHSATTGGQGSDVAYVIFAGSGNGKPRTPKAIKALGSEQFEPWGGIGRLRKVKR